MKVFVIVPLLFCENLGTEKYTTSMSEVYTNTYMTLGY